MVVGELLWIQLKVFTNEIADSTVVKTGIPISTAFLRIKYSSNNIPTYFSKIDVEGILIIKSIFRVRLFYKLNPHFLYQIFQKIQQYARWQEF